VVAENEGIEKVTIDFTKDFEKARDFVKSNEKFFMGLKATDLEIEKTKR